jgi:hypothetical protein
MLEPLSNVGAFICHTIEEELEHQSEQDHRLRLPHPPISDRTIEGVTYTRTLHIEGPVNLASVAQATIDALMQALANGRLVIRDA